MQDEGWQAVLRFTDHSIALLIKRSGLGLVHSIDPRK